MNREQTRVRVKGGCGLRIGVGVRWWVVRERPMRGGTYGGRREKKHGARGGVTAVAKVLYSYNRNQWRFLALYWTLIPSFLAFFQIH